MLGKAESISNLWKSNTNGELCYHSNCLHLKFSFNVVSGLFNGQTENVTVNVLKHEHFQTKVEIN